MSGLLRRISFYPQSYFFLLASLEGIAIYYICTEEDPTEYYGINLL